jgi:hypothetical protein
MSAHLLYLNDKGGSIVDFVVFCTDSCHRYFCTNNGFTYEGWNGCHDLDKPTPCAVCGRRVEGIE